MHHPTLQPSSYPAWAKCPHYQPAPATRVAVDGTRQHELLADFLTGRKDPLTADEDKDTLYPVRRAHRLIREYLAKEFGGNQYLLDVETMVEDDSLPHAPFGTADIIATDGERLIVLDYKSHATSRSHWEQLAFYAQAKAKKLSYASIKLCVVYGDIGTIEEREVTLAECEGLVAYAIGNRLNKDNLPRHPSPWCSLCDKCGACEPAVSIVSEARSFLPADECVGTIPRGMFPHILSMLSEVEARGKLIKEYAKKIAVDNDDVLVDMEGNPVYKIARCNKRHLNIKMFFNQIRTMVGADELLSQCTLSMEKAKSLLKGKEYLGEVIKNATIEELISASCDGSHEELQLRKVRGK
jgi:hypothetical protein